MPPNELLTTGQRVLDAFFPLARGGAAAIPGGFGAGKTITQHQIAKWSNAQVVVYVGCGERGNEMTEVLQEFPELKDPRSGRPLMERTILIANTSNMPVAAREASIYTGVTLAEYYRDMGYHVAMMADSTSRWAEALREISGRLRRCPPKRAIPLTSPRALRGSTSAPGASPHSAAHPDPSPSSGPSALRRRLLRSGHPAHPSFHPLFWALDKTLASARHFPSVNWLESYSEYANDMAAWWREQGYEDWYKLRGQALELLQHEDHLQQIVKLVGPDALPDDQRLILETARLLREGFLQQNALDPIDTYSTIEKQIQMLRLILHFHNRAAQIIAKGCPIVVIHDLPGSTVW
jgi:V/A-type H+-transporting ATPase subunit A